MSLDLSQFHQVFFEECAESLDGMEQSLLGLSLTGDDTEAVNTIFRGAHSIKGGAATFTFNDVASFTHAMETLLDMVRGGKKQMGRSDVDLLLASVDCLRGMLAAHRDGGHADAERVADLQHRLNEALNASAPPAPPATPASAPDQISEREFENLLDRLHGKGKGPGTAPGPRIATHGSEQISEQEFENLLDRLHGKGKGPGATAPVATHGSEQISEQEFENLLDRLHGKDGAPGVRPDWRIVFRPHPPMMQTGNDPIRIFRELALLGRLRVDADVGGLPTLAEMNPEESCLGWTLELASPASEPEIRELFAWVEDECDLEIACLREQKPAAKVSTAAPAPAAHSAASAPAPDAAAPAPAPAPASVPAPAQSAVATAAKDTKPATGAAPAAAAAKPASPEATTIRVGIDKIDALINMVGELVITQSMLNQLGDNFDMDRLPKLLDGLAQLDRNTRELQESVMRIRMIPISFAFNRFPRLAHDLSGKLGKKIELKMTGEQTELDKTVMEKIGDPLVHLVRNSLDHGIEKPEVRRAAGKPETGTLHLNAYHQSGNIVIEITDDGAGLNKERILAKAKERGLVKDEAGLTDEKIYELIFMPGFSTAEQVSDLSGRGVGMDVVRRNIKALGGNVEIRSQQGMGTTITIRLPLTLAILDGQTVRVGDQTYIIPLVSIVETVQIDERTVNMVAGKAEVIRLREEYLPVLRLYRVFRIKPSTTTLREGLLVVVEGDGLKAGLFVDELLGQQQVVIKSLEANFRRVQSIAGATILGDGTVALILDVPGLIRLAQNRALLKDEGAAAQTSNPGKTLAA
jgi:two-component system chemotaxis sensor kinase CheA